MTPITEIVVHEKTGFLFRGLNVQDAVKQLYRILDYPELHPRMSKAAIEHVQDHFAIQVVAEQYIELLKELIPVTKEAKDVMNEHD